MIGFGHKRQRRRRPGPSLTSGWRARCVPRHGVIASRVPRAGFWRERLKPGGRRRGCWGSAPWVLFGAVGGGGKESGVRFLIEVPARVLSAYSGQRELHLWRRLVLAGVETGQASAVSGGGERVSCPGGSRGLRPGMDPASPSQARRGTCSQGRRFEPRPFPGTPLPSWGGASSPRSPNPKFP